MTTEQIRQLHRARPFSPFVIRLADGSNIIVLHNEFLSISPSGRTIIVHQPDDSYNVVDLLLVTDLEVKADTASSAENN